jgi:hypothetical protein
MKALTVQQPWAWAIARGSKDVENRTWRPLYSGPLAIHAGKAFDQDATLGDPMRDLYRRHWPVEQPKGAVIAVADLVGAHHASQCGGRCSPWAMPDQWHWTLERAGLLPEPVPMRGRLGLWDWTPVATS